MKIRHISWIHIVAALTVCCWISEVTASSLNTYWEGLAHNVSLAVESYAERNNGALPPNLDSLFTGANAALIEEELGGPISSKVIYLKDNLPKLESSKSSVVAVVAFPINEDRRNGVGRYIVYRNEDGKIGSRWESEDVLQSSLAKANITLPPASVYNEMPLKPLSPEYSVHLIESAVKQGVSMQDAMEAVEKHVDNVVSGRAKEAKNWNDVVTDQPEIVSPPSTTMPTQGMPKLSTPRPTASAAPVSTVVAKEFQIVPVAIIAVVIVGMIVFFLRRKSP